MKSDKRKFKAQQQTTKPTSIKHTTHKITPINCTAKYIILQTRRERLQRVINPSQ